MRRVWRLHHNPQLLASKVYNIQGATNAPRLNFLTRCHSWGSRGLQHATTILEKLCVWKIDTGCHIGVLKDRWVKDHVPLRRDHIPLRLAAKLRVQDFIIDNNGGWNVLKVNQFLTPSST